MTIDPDGAILLSPKFSDKAKTLLQSGVDHMRIAEGHQPYLALHRQRFQRAQGDVDDPP
jgi:hypothetical protein